jgi:signal transduction histidine kinase
VKYNFSTRSPRILIRFSYPVFNPLNDAGIEYRLLKSDEEDGRWLSSINNQLEFSSLPPGSYTLELRPALEYFPSEKITRLSYEIVPLWWQRPVSKFFGMLLLFAVLFFVVRRFVSAQYEKKIREQTMIENERNRIAADMHDDIGSDLTQISLWSNVLKSTPEAGNGLAVKLARSSEEILEKMDQIIWALNPAHDHSSHLISYLNEYASQYLETASISYHYTLQGNISDAEISAGTRRNVFLIMKEMLHNTVKHSKAKNVSITISNDSANLIIGFADDGIGFNPQVTENGLGLITMLKRAKEINASFEIDSKPGMGSASTLKIKL